MTATVLRFRRRPSEEDVVGTCDWGGCDRDTAALRWDGEGGRWLSVCSRHVAPPWVPLVSVPSPPMTTDTRCCAHPAHVPGRCEFFVATDAPGSVRRCDCGRIAPAQSGDVLDALWWSAGERRS